MELMELARQAEPILREAGELVRSMAHPKVYTKEGHANFVTEADLASQKFLLEHLSPPGAGGALLRRGAKAEQDGAGVQLGYRPH